MRFLVFLSLIFITLSQAKPLRIEITKGVVDRDPIVVERLGEDGKISKDIRQVVVNNLENSGLFELRKEVSDLGASNRRVHFVISGNVREQGEDVQITFTLKDVITGKKLLGLSLSTKKTQWRTAAHMMSDAVYSRITGETGFFNSQIVYVETVAKGKNPRRRLMLAWQDGAEARALTDGTKLVLTPRYSVDGSKIAYMVYTSKSRAEVYVFDLNTRKNEPLGNFEGMTYAPRFSPDGQTVVMSLVKGGMSAIYTMNIKTRQLLQLTQHRSIDTSPCFSPKGDHIVFTSDRDGGKETIYIMDKNGHNSRRLTFGEGKYSQPVWSPRGDMIAFTKQIGNQFYIGVISPEGTGERMIADGYLLEESTWSPNGRYLAYTKENSGGSKSMIQVVDLTGNFSRQISLPKDGADCTWSPLIAAAPIPSN